MLIKRNRILIFKQRFFRKNQFLNVQNRQHSSPLHPLQNTNTNRLNQNRQLSPQQNLQPSPKSKPPRRKKTTPHLKRSAKTKKNHITHHIIKKKLYFCILYDGLSIARRDDHSTYYVNNATR